MHAPECAVHTPPISPVHVASMRPGRARPGMTGWRFEIRRGRLGFNEAGARTPRNVREAGKPRIGREQASMRPGRARPGMRDR